MILPIIFFSYVYPTFVFAGEQDTSINEYGNIYRYNALENENSFVAITDSAATNPEEKLEEITQKQISSTEKSEHAITVIESRNRLKVFFVGNRLGVLRYQMVQMQDQNRVLNALALDTQDRVVENQINNQVDALELQQVKVENFILKQKDRFSLFGWLVNSI